MKTFEDRLKLKSFQVVMQENTPASQEEVAHVHMHIIPTMAKGGNNIRLEEAREREVKALEAEAE